MKLNEEAARCLLCEDAKCSAVCPKKFDPARMVRAVRFENGDIGANFVDKNICAECEGFLRKGVHTL